MSDAVRASLQLNCSNGNRGDPGEPTTGWPSLLSNPAQPKSSDDVSLPFFCSPLLLLLLLRCFPTTSPPLMMFARCQPFSSQQQKNKPSHVRARELYSAVEDKKTTNLPKRKQHQQAAEEKSRTNNYLPADVLISKPKNKPTEKKTINNRLQMCGAATAVTSACCTLYSDVRVFCAELLIDFCTQLRSDCITSTHAITRSFFATREEGTEKERERVRCCKTESAVASLS